MTSDDVSGVTGSEATVRQDRPAKARGSRRLSRLLQVGLLATTAAFGALDVKLPPFKGD
jgi:hypothetical protein